MNRIDLIKEMLQQDPNDPFLHYALALELEKNNQVGAAIQQLQELKLKHSDYLPVYYKLGKLLEAEQNLAAASSIYREGIELARIQSNTKTLAELKEALFLIEE